MTNFATRMSNEAQAVAQLLEKAQKHFVTEVDGFVYYAPPPSSEYFSSWMLRVLADELDKRNASWETAIQEYFEDQDRIAASRKQLPFQFEPDPYEVKFRAYFVDQLTHRAKGWSRQEALNAAQHELDNLAFFDRTDPEDDARECMNTWDPDN